VLSLDPIATARIEELMREMKGPVRSSSSPTTAQAARASDRTAFYTTEVSSRATAALGVWSSSTRPRRSSPARPMPGRRLRDRLRMTRRSAYDDDLDLRKGFHGGST
jgi:hypothetical protein